MHCIFKMLTLLLTLSSLLAHASDRDHALPWKVAKAKDSCSLSAALSESSDIRFIAEAGNKPVLRINTAFRNRFTHKGTLSVIAPPWREHQPVVVNSRVFKPASQLTFNTGIQQTLDAMADGEWIQISLTNDEGNTWSTDISSISIANKLNEFNNCRNLLPPLSLSHINDTVILYGSNSLIPTISGKWHVRQIIDYLKYDKTITAITIDGHTDRTGNHLSNLRISKQRSEYVKRILLKAGIKADMITHVRGHGSRYPLNVGRTAAQRQANRRVEVKLLRIPPPPKPEELDWS